MTIAFVGGGTLGHIYPALSIINLLKEKNKDTRIIFITTNKDKTYLESINNEHINRIYYIEAKGLNKNPIKLIRAISTNIKAQQIIKKIIKQEKVNLIIGMGGYISGLTVNIGIKYKIKTVIHEQNSILGLANRLVCKKANMLLTAFPLKKYHDNQFVVGNPRYDDAKNYKENQYRNKRNILVTSVTNGAEVINDIAVKFLNSEDSHIYTTTLITGNKYYESIKKKLLPGNHYQILPFSNKMLDHLNSNGIIICRSGATTIFEILGSKIIPLFIPSKNVTNDHQLYNAKYVINKQVGLMIKESDLTYDEFITKLRIIDKDYDVFLSRMKEIKFDNTNQLIINLLDNLMKEIKDV